jgi:hypothetical protein
MVYVLKNDKIAAFQKSLGKRSKEPTPKHELYIDAMRKIMNISAKYMPKYEQMYISNERTTLCKILVLKQGDAANPCEGVRPTISG